MNHPGEHLRQLRRRLNLSLRMVEEYSRKIAEAEGNEDYSISNGFLTQVESRDSTPSIHKLFSLSVIYRVKFTDLLGQFGVDLEKICRYQLETPLPGTHLLNLETPGDDRPVTFPVRFDAAMKPGKTNLLSRMVEVWGEVPVALIRQLDFRNSNYGYIGLSDYFMYPLLRPGSFVQIDTNRNTIQKNPWRAEADRPIYFVELDEGYACSWCELQHNHLLLIPHPLSPCAVRKIRYPGDVEIVGQVTAVAARLAENPTEMNFERLPAHYTAADPEGDSLPPGRFR